MATVRADSTDTMGRIFKHFIKPMTAFPPTMYDGYVKTIKGNFGWEAETVPSAYLMGSTLGSSKEMMDRNLIGSHLS